MYHSIEKAAPGAGTPGSGTEQKINLSVSPSGRNVKYRYVGMGADAGTVVEPEDAMEYALERCGLEIVNYHAPDHLEFSDMFLDWFYQIWEREECSDAI